MKKTSNPAYDEWFRLRKAIQDRQVANDAEALAEFVAYRAEPGVDDWAIRAALRLLDKTEDAS